LACEVVAFSRSSTSLKAVRAEARRAWSSLFPAAASVSAACRRSSNVERAELGCARARLDATLVGRVEEHRRLHEQVVREDQDAREEDQRLQRDLEERAHQQRTAALVDRLRGEIALDLALVATEVGEHQEEARDGARPDGVLLREVEREVERPEPAGRAGDVQRLAERHVVGKPGDERNHRSQHAKDDDRHLLDVGPRHRLHAAEHRVDRRRHANREDREREIPAEHDREDDRGRRDDDAAGEAAAGEEQQRRQPARLRVEPLLEILVGGVDPGPVEERHHREREDHHRDRQAEIELHESHAVGISLPRRPHQRDSAQLRGHHREARGPPRQAALGQ
jgi:hypothetical protein